MKIPIAALLTVAVLISGLTAVSSPSSAKRKYAYGYASTYGYRVGSLRWWRAMDRAGRGGRPGGF
ncbi:MAG TPA: hypothetical protein VKF35_10510 [Hyphomicrobiaceae bacterium]|nr:hypothetical protein [Hyphomicrobiaceae bacterium]